MQFRVWFSRTLFESMLIVISILLALTVAAIQEEREIAQLVSRSLASFEYELSQNKGRVDDVIPFHLGLQSLLMELEATKGDISTQEFRDILDSFESAVLLTSAWDTALATGALSEMDYEIVAALSLTYSIQNRFQALHNAGLTGLMSPANLSNQNMAATKYAALRFMHDVTTAENQLQVVYQQALELIASGGGHRGALEGQLLSDAE